MTRTQLTLLGLAGTLGALAVVIAVTGAFTGHGVLRWIGIFALGLAVLLAGLTLWEPNLHRRDDREKMGVALLAASLFFSTGAFMALQTERVNRSTSEQRIAAERGFDRAAEKRNLIVELGVRRNLTAIDLRRRDISGAALKGRALHRARLDAANLNDSDLTGARMRRAVLDGTRLQNAQLQRADLRGARLFGADLRRADLRGADLRGTRGLLSARLRGARVDAATRWPDLDSFAPRAWGLICVGGCGTPA